MEKSSESWRHSLSFLHLWVISPLLFSRLIIFLFLIFCIFILPNCILFLLIPLTLTSVSRRQIILMELSLLWTLYLPSWSCCIRPGTVLGNSWSITINFEILLLYAVWYLLNTVSCRSDLVLETLQASILVCKSDTEPIFDVCNEEKDW